MVFRKDLELAGRCQKLQPIPSGWGLKEWALLQFDFPAVG